MVKEVFENSAESIIQEKLAMWKLKAIVENFISLYGHGYCRSMMQGIIRHTLGISSGIVSQRRIARSLKR